MTGKNKIELAGLYCIHSFNWIVHGKTGKTGECTPPWPVEIRYYLFIFTKMSPEFLFEHPSSSNIIWKNSDENIFTFLKFQWSKRAHL